MNNGSSPPPRPVGFLDPARVVNLFVCRPIGLAVSVVQAVPGVVGAVAAEGRKQIQRAPAKVRKARAIGQLAVTLGGRQVRRRVDSRLRDARRTTGGVAQRPPAGRGAREAPGPPRAHAQAEPAYVAPPATVASTVPVTEACAPPSAVVLAIPEYDGLSASQVVSRLAGLNLAELEAVRAYEAANRGRKTVLAAVERLSR